MRVVPLADVVIPILRSQRARQNAQRLRLGPRYHDADLLFCNPDGTPWPPDTFTKQFAQIARFVGMKGFRFHDVRHAFATLTLKNGKGVSKW